MIGEMRGLGTENAVVLEPMSDERLHEICEFPCGWWARFDAATSAKEKGGHEKLPEFPR